MAKPKSFRGFDRWAAKYRLRPNTIAHYAPIGGAMFEDHGPELEEVLKVDPAQVWTVFLELTRRGQNVIISGFHRSDRMGYLITEVPWEGPGEAELRY